MMNYPLQLSDSPLVLIDWGIVAPNAPVVGQLALPMDSVAVDYLKAQIVLDCQGNSPSPFDRDQLDDLYCLLPDETEIVLMSRYERQLLARYTSYCYGQAWEAGNKKRAELYSDFMVALCHTTKIRFEMKANPVTDFLLLNQDALGWAVTCLALFFGLLAVGSSKKPRARR